MLATILIALSGALGVAACGFFVRLMTTSPFEPHWSGWATLGCTSAAAFFLILGARFA